MGVNQFEFGASQKLQRSNLINFSVLSPKSAISDIDKDNLITGIERMLEESSDINRKLLKKLKIYALTHTAAEEKECYILPNQENKDSIIQPKSKYNQAISFNELTQPIKVQSN